MSEVSPIVYTTITSEIHPDPLSDDEPEFVSVEEAAKILNLSSHYVYTLVRDGKLSSKTMKDRRRLISKAGIEEYRQRQASFLIENRPTIHSRSKDPRPRSQTPPSGSKVDVKALVKAYNDALVRYVDVCEAWEVAVKRVNELTEERTKVNSEVNTIRKQLDSGLSLIGGKA